MPSIENVRAILTTPWTNKGYKARTVRQIESYYLDNSLDNDSDQWQLEIGDPTGDLIKALKRNNELRVQLFGVGAKNRGTDYLVTGIADEISYNELGVLRIGGRDLSSVATDSTIPPNQYRHVRAWKIVEQQARELGIGHRLNLSKAGIVKKAQYTDGSETYWEFWHRLYRKEQMWIWFGPQGYLNAQKLHYHAAPSYFFGKPKSDDSARIKELYIPVENAEIRKQTQGRIGEIWVYGHKGDNGFLVTVKDPQMAHWLKKPRKIMYEKDVHNRKAANRVAWEEIFEGKVGSIEISITIGDPGYPIRPNRVARLRVPEMNLFGDYFVVGSRIQAGQNGFIQEVRLREKQYAISRRIPDDPKIDTKEPPKGAPAGLNLDVPHANDFVKAAKEFHGPWSYPLFLATLLAIADQETGGTFKMIRANGGPGEDHVEWYKWEPVEKRVRRYADDPAYGQVQGPGKDRFGRTEKQWKTIFANEPGSEAGATFAVGIMQLYSLGFKHYADDYMRPGFRNQYYGGRWHAPSNIRAGARALRNKLQAAVKDSGRDMDMWAGVSYYGHHYANETPTTVPTRYAVSVKNKVFNNPGYMQQVNEALDAANEAVKAKKDYTGTEGPSQGGDGVPTGMPANAHECLKILRALGAHPTEIQKRHAVRACALYGHYHRDEIDYSQGKRAQDFGPPPNVPANLDCSSFAEWCYMSCGLNSPSRNNYHPIGNTAAQVANGTPVYSINGARPGDLFFYGGAQNYPGHVAVYIGGGKVVSMGSTPGPLVLGAAYRSDRGFIRSYIT